MRGFHREDAEGRRRGAALLALVWLGLPQAHAATRSEIFQVGAFVVAPCRVVLSMGPVRPGAQSPACLPAPVVLPRPIVRTGNGDEPVLTLEF